MIFNQIQKFSPKRKKKCQKMVFFKAKAQSVGKFGPFGKEKTCP
jgi:hypothetical protein